jgi:hypothetical protein
MAQLLRHLPSEAALSGNDGFSAEAFILFDLVHVQTGTPHPADPRVIRAADERRKRLEAGRARAAGRRNRLGIKGSILD